LKTTHQGESVPSIIFSKGGGLWLEEIAATGVDAVGMDWTVNLGSARARIGERCALQGNLDPVVLFAGDEQIRREVATVIESYRGPGVGHAGSVGHIFNLGHGISQFTPPQAVSVLIDAVHGHRG
jgi:uroporphyrinogen decarboxylase